LGAGVWEGVVEVDARGRGRERVRRVRSVRIISERLFGVGFVMRLGLSFEGDGAYVFEGCGGSLCTFLNRGCWWGFGCLLTCIMHGVFPTARIE
jgi:hypothetical protein